MPSFTPETCPRCQQAFQCGAVGGACDCFTVSLSADLQAQLAAQYPDRCLCMACLRELATPPLEAKDRP